MRFNLKAMLVAGAIAPPVLAWLWMLLGQVLILVGLYLVAMVLILDDGT